MKPSPANLQELYLQSLAEIGVDPLAHDIRFVEDDWESPTLGAWGLGWEVWCDGMEVTQFTYFQQMGGFDCKPVAGELTYGLERLAMYIQGKESLFDLEARHGLPSSREYFRTHEFRGRCYAAAGLIVLPASADVGVRWQLVHEVTHAVNATRTSVTRPVNRPRPRRITRCSQRGAWRWAAPR